MITLQPTAPVHRNWGQLHGTRQGILLHYDDSSSDRGALTWLTTDPRCDVSYNVLITRDGVAHIIAPMDTRAWHAGVCQPSDPAHPYTDANAAFYGVAIAAHDGEVATPAQFLAVVEVCRLLAAQHGWDLAAAPWRITGHDREAWPRGRKIDPHGSNGARQVLSVDAVRAQFTQPAPLA